LNNELIINADILVTYPVDGRFPSLNLAQSVACFCYEWASFSEAMGPPPGWTMEEKPAAPRGAFESFFDNLIAELDDSRFFWPDDRKVTMVETLRNALVRGRFTMGEISLIRGAFRSLVEGPRRRATQSDAARARAVAQEWLAQRPDWNDSMSIECFYAPDTIVALISHGDGRTSVVVMTLKDWQVASAQAYPPANGKG
jgi:hypothetical protein